MRKFSSCRHYRATCRARVELIVPRDHLDAVNSTSLPSSLPFWRRFLQAAERLSRVEPSEQLLATMDSSNMQCYCGKTFYQLNAFSNHQRHCKSSQERLSLALSKAQEIWAKKREKQRLKKIEEELQDESGGVNVHDERVGPAQTTAAGPSSAPGLPGPLEPQYEPQEPEINHMAMVCKLC